MDSAERKLIEDYLDESLQAMQAFVGDRSTSATILLFANVIAKAMSEGGKLMTAGNGGSAADAQHIAGEFISRLSFDRAPLPAVALTVDTSVLTATGNDYGYEKIFERQVAGLGRQGDVFLAISTSGKSPNILRALDAARGHGIIALGFTGAGASPMDERCDHIFHAPSAKTSVIQQIHIVAAHLVCGLVEKRLCGARMAA